MTDAELQEIRLSWLNHSSSTAHVGKLLKHIDEQQSRLHRIVTYCEPSLTRTASDILLIARGKDQK